MTRSPQSRPSLMMERALERQLRSCRPIKNRSIVPREACLSAEAFTMTRVWVVVNTILFQVTPTTPLRDWRQAKATHLSPTTRSRELFSRMKWGRDRLPRTPKSFNRPNKTDSEQNKNTLILKTYKYLSNLIIMTPLETIVTVTILWERKAKPTPVQTPLTLTLLETNCSCWSLILNISKTKIVWEGARSIKWRCTMIKYPSLMRTRIFSMKT